MGALLEKGNLFVVQSINAVFPVQKYSEKKKKKNHATGRAIGKKGFWGASYIIFHIWRVFKFPVFPFSPVFPFVFAIFFFLTRQFSGEKKFFFRKIFGPLGWVWGHRKMPKNAKIGCFDHLWLHQIHVSEEAYTIPKSG